MKMKYLGLMMLTAFFVLTSISFALAQGQVSTVCCERTIQNLTCQNVPEEQCAEGVTPVPTSCESTSFCKQGYCFDSSEGTCMGNTPQLTCNENGGVWAEEFPPQCGLGCCTLGDQASFVTLTRCKRLSSFLGLQTNFNRGVTNEVQCILSVLGRVKGACVFEEEFERTCKSTTREECDGGENVTAGEFFPGKLCSAEELATNCGPTEKTGCFPGKEGVYFIDSCGNPANIYDASKVNNKEYWGNIRDSSESCSPNSANANSKSCGNCDYLLGSICREAERGNSPSFGDFICTDLNCEDENGDLRRHGESWCVYDDAGSKDALDNSVGSRFFKHICVNGEVLLEQCEDFRNEVCIEQVAQSAGIPYSQAGCRVNRWRDCVFQNESSECENTDKRDCSWIDGNNFAVTAENIAISVNPDRAGERRGGCFPKNTPGLKFWEGEDAQKACNLGSTGCSIIFSEDIFGSISPEENIHCLENQWLEDKEKICKSLGDCGVKINWIGESGPKIWKDFTDISGFISPP